MGLREEKKVRLKNELYETAMIMFKESGFDETRVADIARAVMVSEPTFFAYFPSKESVLEEYAVRLLDRYWDLIAEQTEPALPVATRLQGLVKSLAEIFTADPEVMRLVTSRTTIFSGAEGSLLERELKLYEVLTRLIADGQASGELRNDIDASEVAEAMVGAYLLIGLNWLVGWWGDDGDLVSRLGRALDLILHGCLAKTPSASTSRTRTRAPARKRNR